MSEAERSRAYEHRTEQLPDWRTPEWVTRLSELVEKVQAEDGGWMPVGVVTSTNTFWAYVVFERPVPA